MTFSAGFDVGGTNLKAVVLTEGGEVVRRALRPSGPEPLAWRSPLRALCSEFTAEFGPIGRVGIAAPGLVPPSGDGVHWMIGHRSDLVGFDFAAEFPEARVRVANDGRAALWAEACYGAARGVRNAFMLTLGTGVGGAALVDGHLLEGALGRAGHLGHITLDADGPRDIVNTPGSLELAVGNVTIGQRQDRYATTLELIEAARVGEPAAQEVWRTTVRHLAVGIVSLINVLDPEVVVLGGGIAEAGDALFDPLREEMERVEWRPYGRPVRVVKAELGEVAGAVGAAALAL